MTEDLYPNTNSYLWLVNMWVIGYFLNCVTKLSSFIDDKYKTCDYYFLTGIKCALLVVH